MVLVIPLAWRRPHLPEAAGGRELLDDYVEAEDALRAFTDRNVGRMCAICARWTLYAAQVNAAASEGPNGQVAWRVQSWVANCCNANHALESMSDESLSGVVASREAGREWWRRVERAAGAPCAALTESGCALKRGRPELCNRYFCEGVRDYLWALGGERHGPALAAQLDELQRRWAALYAEYQKAIREIRSQEPPESGVSGATAAAARGQGSHPATGPRGGTVPRHGGSAPTHDQKSPKSARLTNVQYRRRQRVRAASRWQEFFRFLDRFDAAIARHARPVTPAEMTERFFKVNGDRNVYEPFFVQEMAAVGGRIRAG